MKLEGFVVQESVKGISQQLINAETDTVAINLIREVPSCGELKKVKAFMKCQRKEIGNNFSAFAIFISVFALALPAFEKVFKNYPSAYVIICISIALSFGYVIYKEGIPFIDKTNEYNSKIDYIIYLIDEEISTRQDTN